MAALPQKREYAMSSSTTGTSKSAQRSSRPSARDGCPTTVVNLFDSRHPRAPENASALERMPHLVERTCLLWGQGEFETYVNRLVLDSRDGARQGLPWEAAEELLFLAELSMAKRALHAAEVTGVPFEQMFARCLENADKIGQFRAPGPGLALTPKTDPWADPRSNRDAGRNDTLRNRAKPEPLSSSRAPAKKNWWQLLG